MADKQHRTDDAPAEDVAAHGYKWEPDGAIRQPAPEGERPAEADAEPEGKTKTEGSGPDKAFASSDRNIKRDIVPVVW